MPPSVLALLDTLVLSLLACCLFLYFPHYIHALPYCTILCYYGTTLIIWTSIILTFNYPEQIFALIKIAIVHVMSVTLVYIFMYILNLYIRRWSCSQEWSKKCTVLCSNLENVSSSSEAKVWSILVWWSMKSWMCWTKALCCNILWEYCVWSNYWVDRSMICMCCHIILTWMLSLSEQFSWCLVQMG